jgi:adenylate cyclase
MALNSPLDTERDEPAVIPSLTVYHKSVLVYSTRLNESLLFGRQQNGESPPYTRHDARVIIARAQENDISREHVLVEPLTGDRILVANRSRVNPILLGSSDIIQPGTSRETSLPVTVTVGKGRNCVIQLEREEVEPAVSESVGHKTLPPGQARETMASIASLLSVQRSGQESESLIRGLQAAVGFLHLATSSVDFLGMAAEVMIDILGLETAAALKWQDGNWTVEALRSSGDPQADAGSNWAPSRTILDQVQQERCTCWQAPDSPIRDSLRDVRGLVAAPILNREAEVVGALYGDRTLPAVDEIDSGISELEAIMVELLATSVAATLARHEQEKAVVEARVLFEQFFSPELSRQLEVEPDLLLGRDSQVTLLFCNIRRFSSVTEQLGARLTLDWINDVMGALSGCVANHHGVLVDTLGDELIGMWGAPMERPDHAVLACRAAMDMFNELPGLNRRWRDVLEHPVDLGIGVHTGIARVGNIGSAHKFKYGPLGNTVTIARLTETATEQLDAKLLITDTTVARLDRNFATRRLWALEAKGLGKSIDLYELVADVTSEWSELKRLYESALNAYERSDFRTATKMLGRILADCPDDHPSLELLKQIPMR